MAAGVVVAVGTGDAAGVQQPPPLGANTADRVASQRRPMSR